MRRCMILLIVGLVTSGQICTGIRPPSVAIIGGGIGGASASHFITELFNDTLAISLFETETIGGRMATVEYDKREFESGGAILHPKNLYMQRFVKLLGLEHKSSSGQEKFGIWNGDEFAIAETSGWSIVSLVKLIHRYGFQIFRLNRCVDDALEHFSKIYDLQDAGRSFANITEMLSALSEEFPDLLQISIKDYLLRMGLGERIIDELVEAVVATNYNQDTDIQSFVSLVSLAGAGNDLWSVKGGNKEVPRHLIGRNKNVMVRSCLVTQVQYLHTERHLHQYTVSCIGKERGLWEPDGMERDVYDIVIIATPLTYDHEHPIEFVRFPENIEFPGSYQTTYATFVEAHLKPKYFGLQEALDVILSSNPNKTKISSLGRLTPVDGMAKDSSQIWKIFSRESVGVDLLHDMFSDVTWKKEIVWKAYPRYTRNVHANNFKLHHALYDVNAIEWAASAMEMSAISGRNVAILAQNDYLQTHFE